MVRAHLQPTAEHTVENGMGTWPSKLTVTSRDGHWTQLLMLQRWLTKPWMAGSRRNELLHEHAVQALHGSEDAPSEENLHRSRRRMVQGQAITGGRGVLGIFISYG